MVDGSYFIRWAISNNFKKIIVNKILKNILAWFKNGLNAFKDYQ